MCSRRTPGTAAATCPSARVRTSRKSCSCRWGKDASHLTRGDDAHAFGQVPGKLPSVYESASQITWRNPEAIHQCLHPLHVCLLGDDDGIASSMCRPIVALASYPCHQLDEVVAQPWLRRQVAAACYPRHTVPAAQGYRRGAAVRARMILPRLPSSDDPRVIISRGNVELPGSPLTVGRMLGMQNLKDGRPSSHPGALIEGQRHITDLELCRAFPPLVGKARGVSVDSSPRCHGATVLTW